MREVGHHPDGVRIVSIVEQHLERMFVEHVHAPRRLEEGRIEGAQSLTDGVELYAQAKCHGGREHGVLHVVGGTALEGRRDQVRPQERDVAAAVV